MVQRDSTVYFLDYTGPAGFPEAVAAVAERVVVLDHHKTAQETLVGRSDLPSNLEVTIDMKRSGATIARDHFQSIPVRPPLMLSMTCLRGHKQKARCRTMVVGTMTSSVRRCRRWLQDKGVSELFDYIEDGDLWQWRLPGAKAFYAGLASKKLSYDAAEDDSIFHKLLKLTVPELIALVCCHTVSCQCPTMQPCWRQLSPWTPEPQAKWRGLFSRGREFVSAKIPT